MGRPRKPLLSKERIYRAALDLVDERGEFTLPDLARRLGVSPSSIYHHVEGRSEIVNGMRSIISADVLADGQFPAGGGTWQEQAVRWARVYRNGLGQHAKAIPVLVGEAVTDDATLEIYERLAALLTDQGFPPRAVMVAVSILDNFVLGSAIDAASPDVPWVTRPPVHPALHEALSAADLSQHRSEAAFKAGVEALVDGLEGSRLEW
ncbi:MAG: Tetracyclin repressor domain protein [Microbacteriaceae bacterium]|jgi:AcrR family transcriptional regulator|nr:Tetracyclin repressor domain protein [Microbacteriaceae bacterium]HEV7957017.1 TetR/AcrR family transcriptional regulator C-terminal domain-containing protein [Marisediminicola sp.]